MFTVLLNIKLKKLISNVLLFRAAIFLLISGTAFSQWCTPTVTETFGHGVRTVKLNGTPPIDRVSTLSENYIVTNVSSTVYRGTQYTGGIVLGFGAFCGAANVRVWIDFNRDYDFADAGEMVYTVNNLYTLNEISFNFMVPNNAFVGTTRMRITSKMQESCGHTLPDPCNDPADPIGYHGEIEDYDLIISNPTGINNISSTIPESFNMKQNFPNPFNPVTNIDFDIASPASVKLTVYNVTGKTVDVLVNETLEAGSYRVDWNAVNYPSGIYYCSITAGNYSKVQKMVLVK